MRKNGGILEGHAWLEGNGVVLGQDEKFVRTFVPSHLTARIAGEAR